MREEWMLASRLALGTGARAEAILIHSVEGEDSPAPLQIKESRLFR